MDHKAPDRGSISRQPSQGLAVSEECLFKTDRYRTDALALGERGTCILGEHSQGVASTQDHQRVYNPTPPPDKEPVTSAKKATKPTTTTPTYRAKELPNNFYASDWMLFFKFCRLETCRYA